MAEKKVEKTKEVVKKEKTSVAEGKGSQYSGKYVVFKEGEYFFKYRLKANNGQALVLSEPYRTEKACREGIDTLKKNVDNLQIDFEKDKHGKWCFRLITKQGRPLAQSANYEDKKRAQSASKSYTNFVATQVIEFDKEESTHYKVELFTEKVQKKDKGKYNVVKDNEGDYMYSLIASNGRVLCTSQAYKSEDSCKEALERFRKMVYEGDFYIFIDKMGNAFFKLYSKQLRLVMTGEVYKTKALAISAVESILAFAEGGKLAQ